MTTILKSENKQDWETPPKLYKEGCKIFDIYPTLDPCATSENTKCKHFFTVQQDGLAQEWTEDVYCNPRFDQIDKWVRYGSLQHKKNNISILMLLPCYTDSKWWQECIGNKMQYVDGFQFLEKILGFWQNGKENKKNKYWMPCVWIFWEKRENP